MEPNEVQSPAGDESLIMDALSDESAGSTPDLGGSQQPVVSQKEVTPPTNTPEKAPAPADDEGFVDKALSIGKDIATGVVAGGEAAAIGFRETARAIGRDVMGLEDPTLQGTLTPQAPQPEGTAGKIAADMTQLVLGFVGVGGKVVKAVAGGVKGVLTEGVRSGIGTAVVADPNRERLSNFLAENDWLQPFFDKLAQDPNDSVLTSKVKAGLEDMLTTDTAGAVFAGLKYLALKATGKGTAAQIAQAEKEAVDAVAAQPEAKPSASASTPTAKSAPKAKPVEPEMVVDKTSPDFQKARTRAINERNASVRHAFPNLTHAESEAKAAADIDRMLEEGTLRFNPKGQIRDPRQPFNPAATVEAPVLEKVPAKAEPNGNIAATNATWEFNSQYGTEKTTITGAQAVKLNEAMQKLAVEEQMGTVRPVGGGPGHSRPNPEHLQPENVSTLAVLEEIGKIAEPIAAKLTPQYRSVNSTKALAEILGEDVDQLAGKLKIAAGAMHDVDAVATGARMALQNFGADTFAAAKKFAVTGDAKHAEEFITKVVKQADFQANLDAVTTGMARGLRSLGEDVGPLKNLGKLRDKLNNPKEAQRLAKLLAATGGDAEKVAWVLKMQNESIGQKLLGSHNEYWMGLGLLSRLTTQVTNLTATGFNVGLMHPLAYTVGGAARLDWQQVKHGVKIWNGMRTALFDSIEVAWRSFLSGKAEISQAGTLEQKTQYISSLTWNMNPDSFMGKAIDLFGNITRLSFRGLTAGDEFFKQISYRGKVAAEASDQAMDLVRAGMLDKKDVDKYVKDVLAKAFTPQGAATNADALKFAEKATFTNDLKGSTWFDAASIGEVSARVAGHPIIRGTLLPFVKTPTNIMRTTFEYTPVIGQLRKQFWTDMAKGGEAQAQAIGKLTLGASFYTAAMYLALEGRITGAPPAPGIATEPGYQPYSVIFRNEDGSIRRAISYQRLQPFGDILGLTYDFAQITGMLDDHTRDGIAVALSLALAKALEDPQSVGKSVLLAGANSLISKNYLRSLTEAFGMLGGYNAEAKAERWLDNKAASYVPGMLAQFNTDDSMREVRSMLDGIMSRIPGLSQTLEPKRDYLGEIKPAKLGLPWSLISPASITEGKADPVMQELARLSSSDAEVKFQPMDHLVVLNGKKIDLKEVKNAQGRTAYDRMTELVGTVTPPGSGGRTFREALANVMDSARYRKGEENPVLDGTPMYPGLRTTLIKEQEERFRKAAFEQMVDEFRGPLGLDEARSVKGLLNQEKVNRNLSRHGIAPRIDEQLQNLIK